MNIQRDDFGYTVAEGKTTDGVSYQIEQIPNSCIAASEGRVVALTEAGWRFADGRLLTRGFSGLDPEKLFEVWVDGDWRNVPALSELKLLTVIPHELYIRGEVADKTIPTSADAYHPRTTDLEPVPRSMRSSDSPHVETFSVGERRFSRLTLEGLWANQATEKASRVAERERWLEATRQAAEEAERSKREAAVLREREMWEARRDWIASLPDALKPDALVIDMREANPCVQQVKYLGVQRVDDEYVFDSERLPSWGTVVSKLGQELSKIHQAGPNYRAWVFDIGRPAESDFFAIYEGPEVSLGSRVVRPQDSGGRFGECRPMFGDVIIAHISVVAHAYCEYVDDEFSVACALELLGVRAQIRKVTVSRFDDEEPDEDGGEGSGRTRYRELVEQNVRDRYPEYHASDFEGGDWPWHSVDWLPADRRLITEEMLKRRGKNALWEAQKATLSQIFQTLSARFVPFSPDDEFPSAGLSVELALTGADLDRLEEFLEAQDCRVRIFSLQELSAPDFLTVHHLDSDRLQKILSRWKAANRSPVIFKAMMADLLGTSAGTDFPVEGVLPGGQVGLLAGPAKLGKSVVAFNLAASVAAGKAFAGLSVQKGKSVFLFGEDSAEVVEGRRRRMAVAMDLSTENLIAIPASAYNLSIKEALCDFKENIPDLKLLVIDGAPTFVADTNNGGAARDFMNALLAFANDTGSTVLVVHHTGKELSASKARSSKLVVEKLKGSAEFFNASRFTLTLHLESDSRDERTALESGLRCLTLHPGNNISANVPRLLGSLRLKMDHTTGLSDCAERPVTGLPQPHAHEPADCPAEKGASRKTLSNQDGDARLAAPVIRRLEAEMGRRLPFGGAKSLYRLKGRGELEGWSRVRCERVHRRAVELGLCRVA